MAADLKSVERSDTPLEFDPLALRQLQIWIRLFLKAH